MIARDATVVAATEAGEGGMTSRKHFAGQLTSESRHSWKHQMRDKEQERLILPTYAPDAMGRRKD